MVVKRPLMVCMATRGSPGYYRGMEGASHSEGWVRDSC